MEFSRKWFRQRTLAVWAATREWKRAISGVREHPPPALRRCASTPRWRLAFAQIGTEYFRGALASGPGCLFKWRAMCAILLFLKWPEPGRVKTRLAATLGAERAAEIYRILVAEVVRRLPGDAELVVMFDPPERRAEIEGWIRGMRGGEARFVAQAQGDLGVRLERAFAAAFALGFEKVAAIGSDCVEITPEIFVEAWRALDAGDAAVGPSADGGYYLLALRRECPRLFAGIAWSTGAVFTQTMERAEKTGLRVRILPTLRDVDTEQDLGSKI